MPQWGATTSNEKKPIWRYLTKGLGAISAAKVFATKQGWVAKHPWGEEVLVAIGGLDTQLGAPTIVDLEVVNALTNVAAANIAFRLLVNEPVAVSGAPTLVALSSTPANVGNVTLVYSASLSQPLEGRLVFANTTVNLNTAGAVGVSLTINASSTLTAAANIADVVTANANVQSTLTGLSASAMIGAA